MNNKILYRFMDIDIIKYIYYNYLSKKVIRKGKSKLIPHRFTKILLDDDSKIILKNAVLELGTNRVRKSKHETHLLLNCGSRLHCEGCININSGVKIQLNDKSKVSLNSLFINDGSVIVCAKSINIGKGSLIGRGVTIYDSDFHSIFDKNSVLLNPDKPVDIGENVWLGSRSIVLKGSSLDNNSVVPAGTVVDRKNCHSYGLKEITWDVVHPDS